MRTAADAIKTETYEHYGTLVHVQSKLKGKFWDHCLCWHCSKLKPGEPDNCRIAQELYELCIRESLVTPVHECPVFVPSKEFKGDDQNSG